MPLALQLLLVHGKGRRWRVEQCSNTQCRAITNRDVNAGKNIINFFAWHAHSVMQPSPGMGQRPLPFVRSHCNGCTAHQLAVLAKERSLPPGQIERHQLQLRQREQLKEQKAKQSARDRQRRSKRRATGVPAGGPGAGGGGGHTDVPRRPEQASAQHGRADLA
jgi:hypothetical protein